MFNKIMIIIMSLNFQKNADTKFNRIEQRNSWIQSIKFDVYCEVIL